MPRYAITEKAGRFVAAHRNTGVGMILELTEKQAEYELHLGTLVALDAPGPTDSAEAMQPETAQPEELPLPESAAVEATRKVRRSKQ